MKGANIGKAFLASLVLLLNVVVIWFAYTTFGLIVESTTIGATAGYGLLFIVLCIGELYVLVASIAFIIAMID